MSIFYALLSLLFFTVSNIYYRIAAKNVESTDTLGMLFTTLAGVFSLPLIFLEKGALVTNDPRAWYIIAAIIGWAIFSYTSAWMNVHYEASLNAILGQLATVFSVLLGVFFLGELLSLPNMLGIFLIILGNVLLASKEKGIKFDKVLIMRIGLSLVLALNFMFDNIASPHFNRAVYIFLAYFIPGLVLWVLVPGISTKSIVKTLKSNWKEVSVLSMTSLFGYYFLLRAYDVGQLSIIVPVMQSSTVTTVLGATVFLKERENMVLKIMTGILVTGGVIVVSLMG